MRKTLYYIARRSTPNEMMLFTIAEIISLPLFTSRREATLWASGMEIPHEYIVEGRRFTLKKPFEAEALAVVIFSDDGEALSVVPWMEFMIH